MTTIPHWLTNFRNVYKPLLKDGYDEFEAALAGEKARHIRLNLSRKIDYLQELGKFMPESVAGLEGVYKINACAEELAETISFQTGGIYIMNPSSVVPARILASLMPHEPLMLDVSSAPGGKTCALSDYVGRRGFIVANEISSSRMKSLAFNLEKYGCYNVRTVSKDGRVLDKMFQGAFNGVLLDAPCSNENKIFRNKTVQKNWNMDLVEKMASIQRQLILSAFDCLCDGGYLVYSTCTLSIEENEGVVKFLLKERSSASLINVDDSYATGGGLSGDDEVDSKVIRITPSAKAMDGFFVAVFKKDGEISETFDTQRGKITDIQRKFFIDQIGSCPHGVSIVERDGRGYMTGSFNPFEKIPMQRFGLNVYRMAGANIEPTSQFVWEKGEGVSEEKRTQITYQEAIEYLKGFDIPKPYKYNGNILFSGNLPVGAGKIVGDNVKNKLDRYFLFGKNIEW